MHVYITFNLLTSLCLMSGNRQIKIKFAQLPDHIIVVINLSETGVCFMHDYALNLYFYKTKPGLWHLSISQ